MTVQPKFIIVVFDGLRRDMITPDFAPNLTRFLLEGADFPMSRSVFPSATRVNAAALSAGAAPFRTGLIANKFFDGRVFDDRVIHTGDFAHSVAAEAAYGGRFLEASTLGECAAAAGLSLAVVSSGSGGTSYLLHPHAGELGHLRLCLRDWNCSTPGNAAAEVLDRFGPLPPAAMPNLAVIQRQTDILLDYVFAEVEPDITIVWFSDPDSTYHQCGLGSPESREAILNADRQFARILDWCRAAPEAERYQIFVMSDHGQITSRDKIDLRGELARNGLALGQHFQDGADFAGNGGYYGAFRLRDGDIGRMAALVDWMSEQPWRGLIFTPNGNGVDGSVHGTLDRALLQLEHRRAPEIYFTMLADDEPNQWGFPGGCYFSSGELPEGGGTHGGLHIKEMNNLLGAQGSLFKHRYVSNWPASHTDIAPTILDLLGQKRPGSMTGRILQEAVAASDRRPPETETLEVSVASGTRRQNLRRWRVGSTTYLDQGWLE